MKVKIVSITQGVGEFKDRTAEDIIVYAARVSSPREDKFESPDGLLKYCINNKHWSIFETPSITFEIETSRAMGRQLLRHQAKFQEFSQRYSEVTSFESFELRKQADKNRQSSTEVFDPIIWDSEGKEGGVLASEAIDDLLGQCKDLYDELISKGVAKESARFILPECAKTTMYMTNNLRNWIHFVQVRDDEHAQKEVREIAIEIKKVLKEYFPIVAKALGW